MKNIFFYLCILTFSIVSFSPAQDIERENFVLTGNLLADSKLAFDRYDSNQLVFAFDDIPDKKSPVLAGVMSAILPGSGELYVGEYIKAAIFFAVEAALVTTAVVYNNKGDNQTAEFQAFADEHWSVVKYSDNLLLQPGLPDGCNIQINPDESLPPWERIVNWNEINICEKGYTHKLDNYGEQQYYELIGKYNQYSSGWDEFDPAVDDFRAVPQIMLDYSEMRGNANDAFNVASKAVIGLYINHLLSAIDAVWSATSYNKNLAINMKVQNIQYADRIEFVPTLNISYNF
ncbi:MAG: hypothetical protein BMS9Abin39_0584 [Ignavibacteria bacterium]|nr:MAG: hypothetical protein BMS9Abin39_0584 [Ignavibacteria bacterium]